MTERRSYGEARVRITYHVEPTDGAPFDADRDATVKMSFLPQAGQGVRVRYDAQAHAVLEVLTPPGEESPPPPGFEPTKEIAWNDTGRANWWANGTRRS
jgi:hypothetical protein